MNSVFKYVGARLNERSTWSDILIGLPVSAALPQPWNYVGFVITVVKTLVPDGPIKPTVP